ncbi:hypothetical protein ACFHW2_31450 [Actinomadura sp. LOL_016]|uniref:hypothetical protein n=1 Tax=unclassified Actinomadura TaxID=2626254 RepID=UPI003A80F109
MPRGSCSAISFSGLPGEIRRPTRSGPIASATASTTSSANLRAGLTRRDHCPADRRGVYTQVTGEGRALQEKASPTYHEELAAALDEAAADPALAPLVRLLRDR